MEFKIDKIKIDVSSLDKSMRGLCNLINLTEENLNRDPETNSAICYEYVNTRALNVHTSVLASLYWPAYILV